METAKRSKRRSALVGCLVLLTAACSAATVTAAAPSERVLPDSTIFVFKLNDATRFREAFRGSHYGQLWNDPGMKDFREDLNQKLEEASRPLKEKVGVGIKDLLSLPKGAITFAVIPRDDAKFPVAITFIADAGENKDKMLDILIRTTKQAGENGAKVSEESFSGQSLHVVRPGDDDKAKKKDQAKEGNVEVELGLAWTEADGVFTITLASPGGEVEVLKDLAAHKEGRDNALAGNESYSKTLTKVEGDKANVVWFLDIARLIKLAIKANSKGNEGQAQQSEVILQELGVNGLKSVGGSFAFGSGGLDTHYKTFFLAPKPVQGLLKIFKFPPQRLRPEPWVPATVASYQTLSWDLDNAYDAINELINKFQPGMLNLVEQSLVGPNGGQPLSIQQDFFGPLGDRITVISDYKKPIKPDSSRMLLGIALEDAKAFQSSLSRLIEIAQANPPKREFQGTTIYDVDMPSMPNPNAAGAEPFKGKISFAIAKNTFFVTSDTKLLEQVLRPGYATLEENAGFQTVLKEMPEKVSGMSFVRPDESAKLVYDLIKSGQYEQAIQQLMGANARAPKPNQIPPIGKIIANEKLPEFSTLAKYLSNSGSYSVADDDGFTMTGFTLKRSGP